MVTQVIRLTRNGRSPIIGSLNDGKRRREEWKDGQLVYSLDLES
jgi:hypothetical protein